MRMCVCMCIRTHAHIYIYIYHPSLKIGDRWRLSQDGSHSHCMTHFQPPRAGPTHMGWPGQDYPLGTIGTVPMAFKEEAAYEAVNEAYENKQGPFFSPHLLTEKKPTI